MGNFEGVKRINQIADTKWEWRARGAQDTPRLYHMSISPLNVRSSMIDCPKKSSLSFVNFRRMRDRKSLSSSLITQTRTLMTRVQISDMRAKRSSIYSVINILHVTTRQRVQVFVFECMAVLQCIVVICLAFTYQTRILILSDELRHSLTKKNNMLQSCQHTQQTMRCDWRSQAERFVPGGVEVLMLCLCFNLILAHMHRHVRVARAGLVFRSETRGLHNCATNNVKNHTLFFIIPKISTRKMRSGVEPVMVRVACQLCVPSITLRFT